MDTGEILNKLKKGVPGSVLEKSRFGRSASLSIWVEAKALQDVAAFLKEDSEIALDWLENLSVIQMDKALAATYFLRSVSRQHTLILRASVEPSAPAKEVDMPSVVGIWAMAAPFEQEIQELFGIRFMESKGKLAHPGSHKLPKNWNGFPLRKTYVFPTEFLGISHVRRTHDKGGNA